MKLFHIKKRSSEWSAFISWSCRAALVLLIFLIVFSQTPAEVLARSPAPGGTEIFLSDEETCRTTWSCSGLSLEAWEAPLKPVQWMKMVTSLIPQDMNTSVCEVPRRAVSTFLCVCVCEVISCKWSAFVDRDDQPPGPINTTINTGHGWSDLTDHYPCVCVWLSDELFLWDV